MSPTIYLGGSRKVVVDLPDGASVVARLDAAEMGELRVGDAVEVGWADGDGILVVDD